MARGSGLDSALVKQLQQVCGWLDEPIVSDLVVLDWKVDTADWKVDLEVSKTVHAESYEDGKGIQSVEVNLLQLYLPFQPACRHVTLLRNFEARRKHNSIITQHAIGGELRTVVVQTVHPELHYAYGTMIAHPYGVVAGMQHFEC